MVIVRIAQTYKSGSLARTDDDQPTYAGGLSRRKFDLGMLHGARPVFGYIYARHFIKYLGFEIP